MTPAIAANLLLFALTVGYICLCAVSPFGPCRKCSGLGATSRVTHSGQLKVGRTCRRCHGVGRRIRIGRHLLNRARRTHRAGTR
ncbi:hypothetical protein [Streptomyces buecherae]|uniref:hypothetical protein n=1 Tax=Streptomyces buecherae TaxID=2763006 RepID=UPI001C26B29F|nr:hypothetical protein [Streptomyces buecherae]